MFNLIFKKKFFFNFFIEKKLFEIGLIEDNIYNPLRGRDYRMNDVFTVFFCILMGSQSLGTLGPIFETFTKGLIALIFLNKIFFLI